MISPPSAHLPPLRSPRTDGEASVSSAMAAYAIPLMTSTSRKPNALPSVP